MESAGDNTAAFDPESGAHAPSAEQHRQSCGASLWSHSFPIEAAPSALASRDSHK